VLPLNNRVIRDSAVQLGLTHQRGAMVLTHRVAFGVGLVIRVAASLSHGQQFAAQGSIVSDFRLMQYFVVSAHVFGPGGGSKLENFPIHF
jgi:hypothetical protein